MPGPLQVITVCEGIGKIIYEMPVYPTNLEHEAEDFARQWRKAAGTDFQPSFKDCLLVATCSEQHQLQLPVSLQPRSPLFNEALRISLLLYQEHYMRDPEALQLLAAPVLVELEEFMMRQATSSTPLLAMWATHDTTILVLLAALGVWGGQWPPYTDTVVLEVYRETGKIQNDSESPESFFRFLHHGVPLAFPWCENPQLSPSSNSSHRSSLIPGLCNVKFFLPPWMAPFQKMERLREACAKANPVELDADIDSELDREMSKSSQSNMFVESLNSTRSLVTHVLFASLFMFLGYSWRELSNNWSSRPLSPQNEALLSS